MFMKSFVHIFLKGEIQNPFFNLRNTEWKFQNQVLPISFQLVFSKSILTEQDTNLRRRGLHVLDNVPVNDGSFASYLSSL